MLPVPCAGRAAALLRAAPKALLLEVLESKMNIYRHRFNARCPSNSAVIAYEIEIQSKQMILVEDITVTCAAFDAGYHEAMADTLFVRFGGQQTMRAHHHGVDIETRRGFE